MSDVPVIEPEQFAALIEQASDDQLKEGLTANRELLIGEVFRRMPERVDPRRTHDVEAVVQWVIREGPGGGPDHYHLRIMRGECTVAPGEVDDFDVRYEIGAVDFIKLVAGVAQGPALFVFGKLRIKGNLMLAARMPGFFVIPRGS